MHTLITKEHWAHFVQIDCWVEYDPDDFHIGFAHFAEHLMLDKSRISDKLSTEENEIWDHFNGEVDERFIKISAIFHYSYTDIAITVLKKIISPDLEAVNYKLVRKTIYEEISSRNSDSVVLLYDLMFKNRFASKTNIVYPTVGRIGDIEKFNRETVSTHLDRLLDPEKVSITVYGKVDERVIKLKNDTKRSPKMKFLPLNYTNQTIVFKNLNQPSIDFLITFPGITSKSSLKERLTLNLIASYLTDCQSSVLFHKLRVEEGSIYDISSGMMASSPKFGLFYIQSSSSEKNLEKNIATIIQEIIKIKSDGLGSKLEYFRRYLNESNELEFDNLFDLASYPIEDFARGEKLTTPRIVIDMRSTITNNDIKNMAEGIFDLDFINLAIVGRIKDQTKRNIRKILP